MTDNISLCPAECVQEEDQEVRAIALTRTAALVNRAGQAVSALRASIGLSRGRG
jgi:hypothetical protein